MRILLVLILLIGSLFAKDEVINIKTPHTISEHKKVALSDKEKAYQEYKKQKEIENKKLEDDGFCSCNND